MTYISPDAQTIGSLPFIVNPTGSLALPSDDGSATGKQITLAQILAWILANDGSTDLTQATQLNTLSTGLLLFGIQANGTLVRVPSSLLSTTSSGTAPSQVGSLTAGTPTSTTIPLTWTTATGTATITYAVQIAVHNSSSFAAASGTFATTGGTVTGLTASTNYDFRVIATNSAGTSTTSLLTGVSTSAASSSYPSMVFNPAATYGTGKFGQGLTGGKGTLQFTVPTSPGAAVSTMGIVDLEFFFKAAAGATTFTSYTTFVKIVDSAGTEWGLRFGGTNFVSTYIGGDNATGNIRDGAIHHIRMNIRSDYNQQNYIETYVDGASPFAIKYDAKPGIATGLATLTVDFSGAAAGDMIDQLWITKDKRITVPSGAGSRDSGTVVLLPFDGNGVGA